MNATLKAMNATWLTCQLLLSRSLPGKWRELEESHGAASVRITDAWPFIVSSLPPLPHSL